MPGMDGIETMQRMRESSAHYAKGGAGKIVVLTANAIMGVRDELLEKGFDEYLSKPIQFAELERVLRKCIAEENFVTEAESKAATVQSRMVVLEDLLPQVNVAAGLVNCKDNEDLYLDILHILHEDADMQLENLQTLLDKKDYSNFIIQIHSMKTQLMNIGYVLLAEDARMLEIAGKENRFGYIEEHLGVFVNSYNDFKNQLETVFAKVG